MKFALSVFSALALASTALGADLEDRSYRYYPAPNHAAQQQANVRTVTVHDTMMATTTATQFVTVTAGAQCTLEGNAAPSAAVTTTTTNAASADAETTTTAAAATTVTSAPSLETTSVAAQERPTTTVETVTSTHTYSTTVVYATPTTVTQMEHDSTVVRTVDVTRTSTRRVVETQVVTRTKTKFVHETVTRTRQAQETGRGNHNNNGNNGNNNNHNGQTTVGRDTTTVGADATTTSATADATTTAAETETTTAATETTTSANAEGTTTSSTSVAATVADVTTTTTGNVATVTDFETSTFLVTTTVDGVVSTETGTTTVAVGTTTDEASTTEASATTTASESSSTSDVAATIADTSSASATASVSDVTGSVAATSTSSADGANNTEDPQTSLTLDPRVIEDGFASDGQNPPVAGQVPSLTSTNNYINFCLTQNVPLTDGKQIREGSCNVVPQGRIIAKDKIPSAKFVFPLNFGTIPANQPFAAKLKIKNLQAGSFTNAQLTYYSAPAQVNDAGILIGHSHLVIEQLRSLDDTEPLDPTKFAFFKGLNAPLDGDSTLSATLDKGLPAGVYRMFSINTAANHQPALASVAQHGSMDDGVYFTAV